MRCVTACDAYDDPSTFADGALSPGPQTLEALEGFRHPVTSCVEADQNRVGGCYPRSQKCGKGLSERQPGRAPSTPAMREDVRGVRTKRWSENGSVSRLASRMCLLADFVRFVLDWGPRGQRGGHDTTRAARASQAVSHHPLGSSKPLAAARPGP